MNQPETDSLSRDGKGVFVSVAAAQAHILWCETADSQRRLRAAKNSDLSGRKPLTIKVRNDMIVELQHAPGWGAPFLRCASGETEGGPWQDGNAESRRPEGCRYEAGSAGAESRNRFEGLCRQRRGYLYLSAGCTQRGRRGRSLREGTVDEGAWNGLRGGRSRRSGRTS